MLKNKFAALFLILLFFITACSKKPAKIAENIEPSVVHILVYDEEGKVIEQGNGFFISENGDVVTNRTLLLKGVTAVVKTTDGKEYPVTKVVAEGRRIVRLAVDIPRQVVRPLTVTSSLPKGGERVVLVGRIEPMVTEATVSEKGISDTKFRIAPSSAKDSAGAPVVNMKGETIGVTYFKEVEGRKPDFFVIPGARVAELTPGRGMAFAEWAAYSRLNSEGLYHLNKGNYQEALNCFKKMIRTNPNAMSYLSIGFCRYKLERYQEAIAAFKQAIRTEPYYAEAHYSLGLAYGGLGRYHEAVDAYKQAIRIKPDYAKAHYSLALTYWVLGDTDTAFEEYNILKKLDKKLANKLLNLIHK